MGRKRQIPPIYRMVQQLYKLDKKWGRYGILKFPFFSVNISWPVLMNIQMSDLMMSFPHNSYTFIYRNDNKKTFQLWDSNAYLLSTKNKWEILKFILTYFNTGVCFYRFLNFMYCTWKCNNICIYLTNSEGMTSPTHSLETWIFIRNGQVMFAKKMKISKFISS